MSFPKMRRLTIALDPTAVIKCVLGRIVKPYSIAIMSFPKMRRLTIALDPTVVIKCVP